MFRKVLILFTGLMLTATSSFGQSTMTDDQVIQFVQERQQRGEDQQAIVTQLMKKGVTAQQLRRVRRKWQAQQEQLGAVDVNGGYKQPASRMRTNREAQREQYHRDNSYMVGRTIANQRRVDAQTRRAEINDEIGFLDIDSLIYYQNLFKDENQVFGRNIFNNEMLSFAPNMNMPTPANYRLGAGDKVLIDVWGASQESFEETISPDGVVVIQGVGPINLGGLTISQAKARLQSQLGRFYASSNISISLGETRSIQVQVMGEVNVPGTYTLSSLSSAFNALYAAGGISDIGTLRDIQVFRQGRKIATIDVYDYILNGNTAGDVRLNDNDIIVVGAYDCLVQIRGKVKRPMFYEMKKSESVKTILSYSGGFTGDAYKKNIRLIRKSGSEYSIHTIGEFDMNGFKLDDGDSIYVDSVVARYSNMAEIRGAVFHPGMYQMDGNIRSVRDLVNAADGLREDAFLARAVMHRRREDMTLEVISIDIMGLMNGTVADIPLYKNDVLFIPSRADLLTDQLLTIEGEVYMPGQYMYAANTTIEDLILQAGGLTDAASTVKVDVYRRIVDAKALVNDTKLTETYSFSIKDGFVVDGEQGFVLQPNDQVVVRKNPAYNEQQNVYVTGSVNFTGQYAMSDKNYKLSDLVRDAGGLSALAYPKGARLERVMTPEERDQREASMRAAQIELYEQSLQMTERQSAFSLQTADSLLNMKLDLGNTYPLAINLDKALEDTTSAANITLRANDRLIVPQYSATVKISGEVMSPISVIYQKGKSLYWYIQRAGGYKTRAKKSKVYAIYMNGSLALLSHKSSKEIQPGCEIVVPSKDAQTKMSTAEMMAIGSTSASMAAVIASIINLLK